MKILPSITTYLTPDWPARIRQLDDLGIKEIALFLTAISGQDRERLYKLLIQTKLQKITHVHLRDDMQPWELDWLVDNYKTGLFNIHAKPEFLKLLAENKKHAGKIYVENGGRIDQEFIEFLPQCFGLCIDFSHWAVGKLFNRPGYDKFEEIVNKNKIGCSHVSAFSPQGILVQAPDETYTSHAPHDFRTLDELGYLVQFKKYLPEYVSLELFNPLKEQLKAKEYLEKLLA